MTPDELYESRFVFCQPCEHRTPNCVCTLVNAQLDYFARHPDANCPIGLWHALSGPIDPALPRPEPSLPSRHRQAWNYASALIHHRLWGRPIAAEADAEARRATCEGCEHYRPSDRRCAHGSCGCYLDVKWTWADAVCPIGLWDAVTGV